MLLPQGKLKLIGGSSNAIYKEKISVMTQWMAFVFQCGLCRKIRWRDLSKIRFSRKIRRLSGDNVSSDLREMLAGRQDGRRKSVDVILQSKDVDNPALRALLKNENVRLSDRIGKSDTLVVDLPLSAVENLSNGGSINYMSPDRQVGGFGHMEIATGTTWSAIKRQKAILQRFVLTEQVSASPFLIRAFIRAQRF